MYYYKLYGSNICSDLEFPQLIEANDWREGKFDIQIQEGILSEDMKRQGLNRKYEIDRKKSWLVNTTTCIVVEDGRSITYELQPNGKLEYLRTYILGFAMSMLYLQRGDMAIHCSAIVKGDKAILIAGESGSGKSTITSHFLGMGYQLMADDMAVVKVRNTGEVKVLPGFPYQKLCRDMAVKKGYDLADCIYIDERKDKFLVPYKEVFSIKEKTLSAIFLLRSEVRVGKLFTEELKGMDKLYACTSNLFLRSLLQEQTYEPKIGERCLQIASAVPIYLIRRPLGQNTVNSILDYILSKIEKEKEILYE